MEKRKIKSELKNTFTSYWEYLALQTACKLNIFDDIENNYNTIKKLVTKNKTNITTLSTLVQALIDADTILEKNNVLILTEKGKILTKNHPETLKNACILWGEEHLTAWQNLEYTIKTGKPAFENIYKTSYFNFIHKKTEKLFNYQLAMSEYARDDYKNITQFIDFSKFKTIADIGGSTGYLIKKIAEKYHNHNCILTDLPEVINLVNFKLHNLKIISANFFNPFSFKADAIILSRILHDWKDEKAIKILENCSDALNPNGVIIIIEIMQNETKTNLLSLNMMLMTESFERTYYQYNKLLNKINFEIKTSTKLNELQTILIAQKK